MVTKEPLVVKKLLPRHTQAGITVEKDDHCVMLKANGAIISYPDNLGNQVMAVWTGPVTINEMVETADDYLDWRLKNEC